MPHGNTILKSFIFITLTYCFAIMQTDKAEAYLFRKTIGSSEIKGKMVHYRYVSHIDKFYADGRYEIIYPNGRAIEKRTWSTNLSDQICSSNPKSEIINCITFMERNGKIYSEMNSGNNRFVIREVKSISKIR